TFQQWHALLPSQRAGGVLETEYAQLLGRRPDEGDASRFTGFGEGGVFRKKAVTGMNGFRTAAFGGVEDLVDDEIGLGCRSFAQAIGLIGLLDMQAGGIGLGENGYALAVECAQGAQNAAGDGAAVGDQEFVEHSRNPRRWRAVPPLFGLHTVVRGEKQCLSGAPRRLVDAFWRLSEALPRAALTQLEQPAANGLAVEACSSDRLDQSHTSTSA